MGFTFLSIISYILLIMLVLFLCIYFYYKRSFKYWKSKGVPHLQPSFPFGNLHSNLSTRSGHTLKDIYSKLRITGARYGGCYLLTMPVFFPLCPDIYKDMLLTNFQHFHDRGMFYDEERDPMSANMVSLSGDKWKYLRNKCSPAFSPAKLKNMLCIITACSTGISNVLENKVKAGSIDVYEMVSRYTSDVICSSAFGIEGNSLKNPDADFIKYGKKLVKLNFSDSLRMALGIFIPDILRFFHVSFFNPNSTSFFYNVAKETVEYREKNGNHRNDFMQLLIRLKHNENIDDEFDNAVQKDNRIEGLTLNQLASQVFVFFLAGFETSAVTLSFALVEMAHNQHIQNQVRNEIENVLKKYHGQLRYETIMDMKYMDQVVYETMRKYPPILMLNRICTKAYKVPHSDLIIEKGIRAVISTLAIHNDPEYYSEPQIFDPERFSEDEKSKRHPFTYLPFGDGPRICIGMRLAMLEMKIGMIQTLPHYKYSPNSRTKFPLDIVSNGNMLVPKSELWLNIEKI